MKSKNYYIKSVFSEIRVRMVSRQKKAPGWPVYQLEACLLTVNHLNSCSDSDLRKNWLALMPPIYYDFRPQLWCHLQDGCLGFGGTFPSDVKCILGHWCYFFQRVSFFITKVCFKEPKKIYIHIQLFGRGAVFYFLARETTAKEFYKMCGQN